MTKDNRFIIKERFKEAANKKGFSQSEIIDNIAERLNVSRKMIEKYVWSSQQSAIPFYRLEMICKELNVSPEYLTRESAKPETYWGWFIKENVYDEKDARDALMDYLLIYYGSGSLLYIDRKKQWEFLGILTHSTAEEYLAYMNYIQKAIDSAVLTCADFHNSQKETMQDGEH